MSFLNQILREAENDVQFMVLSAATIHSLRICPYISSSPLFFSFNLSFISAHTHRHTKSPRQALVRGGEACWHTVCLRRVWDPTQCRDEAVILSLSVFSFFFSRLSHCVLFSFPRFLLFVFSHIFLAHILLSAYFFLSPSILYILNFLFPHCLHPSLRCPLWV